MLVVSIVQCQLVVCKPIASAGGPVRPRGRNAGLRAQQELNIEVPEIEAQLDSRQFEILVDVIQNIFMAPMPQVRGGQKASKMATGCVLHWARSHTHIFNTYCIKLA
jgi:hypothetical protein